MAQPYRAPVDFFCFSLLFAFLFMGSAGRAQENETSVDQIKKLYVLDAGNDQEKPRVLLVDQSNGKVIRTYHAGNQPDMALTPDGTRLFVAYAFDNADGLREPVLDIYDTASGTLIDHVSNAEALQHKIPVYESSMVMAPSGKQIYIEKYHWTPGAPGPSGCYVSVFDTTLRRFRGVNISVSNCGHVVLPANEDLKFYMVSADTHAIDEFTLVIPSDGAANTSHRYIPIKLPNPSGGISEVKKSNAATAPCEVGQRTSAKTLGPIFLQPQDKTIGVVLGDGSRLAVDLSTSVTKFMGKEPSTGKMGGMQTALHGDGSSVYFSAAQETNSYFERYDQIVRIDPATMTITGKMTTLVPFFDISISPDQSTLFAVNPERAMITVIDAPSLKQISQFSAGVKPIFAIPAP